MYNFILSYFMMNTLLLSSSLVTTKSNVLPSKSTGLISLMYVSNSKSVAVIVVYPVVASVYELYNISKGLKERSLSVLD